MKKLFTSFLVLSLVFSLFGCGERESSPQPNTSADNKTEAITESSTEAATEAETEESTTETETTESATETDTTEAATETDTAESATDTDPVESTTERVVLDLEDISETKENAFTCTYDGVKHDFILSLPDEVENAPLIVMFHGAGDSPENFRRTSGFDNDALPKGYAVCYVGGTVNGKAGRNSRSWNYGRLEPDNDDVGFIKALVNYLADEYSIDKEHVFCAGFSNGGFMNFRLALEAQDTVLACVSVGGDLCKTLWKVRPEKNDVGMLVVYGENDESIPKNFDGSSKTALDPAIEDVIDYMASSNGLEKKSEDEIGDGSILCKYGADSDKDMVWSVVVNDGKHGWPTKELDGFSVNELILEFFENWR